MKPHFWDDLVSTIVNNDESHFFGQFVIHNNSEESKKYIIDGQQRTITSMIFMRTMQLFYKELSKKDNYEDAEDRVVEIRGAYLGKYTDNIKEPHLTLSDADRDFYFKHILCGNPSESKEKKKSRERMRFAYNYFFDRLTEVLKPLANADVSERYKKLDEYFKAFTEKFVCIYLEANKLEEAFVIFETLNARGKDLETADLLKNYIFSKSNNITKAQQNWDSICEAVPDPTKYIRHYWIATHGYISDKDLYRTINKEITKPRDSAVLLDNLSNLAPYYHDMVNPEDAGIFLDPEVIRALSGLKTLKAKTFYPLILAMENSDTKFSEIDIKNVLTEIESYMFRNITICEKAGNNADRLFASLAEEVYGGNLTTCDEIANKIKNAIVPDKEFVPMFETFEASKSSKELVRYIFRRIHNKLDKTHEINVDNTEVHIEHIMPEDGSKWSDITKEDHDAYLWRLGNLCLLSQRLNQSIHNDIFTKKQIEYAKSKIEPNSELSSYNYWGVKQIEDRQKCLAKTAATIWKK